LSEHSFMEASAQFTTLLEIMKTLRSPEGCSWDRKQNFQTLRKFVIEEANEVVEAIDKEDLQHLCEELGDLMMIVVFHSQIASESGTFSMTEILKGINEKLVNRHPHVFKEKNHDLNPDGVVEMWGKLKAEEKKVKTKYSSRMREAEKFSSSLKASLHIQEEAAKAGFDFPNLNDAMTKINEEAGELEIAVSSEDAPLQLKEVGDLLFSAVNIARILKIDPVEALRSTNAKFISRFSILEEKVESNGGFEGKSIAELDSVWNEIKKSEEIIGMKKNKMIKAFKGVSPKIDESAFVADNAVIIGNVEIAANASVWYGVTIRGDINTIKIGKDSNIQEHSIIHVDPLVPGSDKGATIIGERVTVGHGAILHACKIGDNCLIGMGAIVLSGAQIGEGSIIGSAALVPEGKVVPPRSLVVGIPGVVKSQIDENKLERIRESAAHYVEISREHKNDAD